MLERGKASDPNGMDRLLNIAAVFLFGVSLGTLSVVVPLLAIRVGYGGSEIGLLVGVAAIAQLIARSRLGAALRFCPDKYLLAISGVMIALACFTLLLSTGLAAFILAQILQGSARALFWTSSQAHAIRLSSSAVTGLRDVSVGAGVGALLGPPLAGYLWGVGAWLPLAVAGAFGALAVVPSLFLVRYPPFARKTSAVSPGDGNRWRSAEVRAGFAMSGGAGAWKGLVDSYVPVVLALAGHQPEVIGLFLGVANACVLSGSTLSGSLRISRHAAVLVSGPATGIGLAAVGLFSSHTVAPALGLALSGVGAGIMQTVGPAMVVDGVGADERGDGLANAGLFRAAALFLAPSGMAGLVVVLPVGLALGVFGLLITAPSTIMGLTRFWQDEAAARGSSAGGVHGLFYTDDKEGRES